MPPLKPEIKIQFFLCKHIDIVSSVICKKMFMFTGYFYLVRFLDFKGVEK